MTAHIAAGTLASALFLLTYCLLRGVDWRRVVRYWLVVYDEWERETFPGRERLQWRRYLEWSGRVAWVVVLVALWVMGL